MVPTPDRPPAPAAASRDGTSGPYSPRKDPVVLLLVAIVAGTVLLMVLGVGIDITGGSPGKGPLFPVKNWGKNSTETTALELTANRSAVEPGGAVRFTVRTDGATVGNATVAVAGDEYATGPDGSVVVRFPRGGNYTATASKAAANGTAYLDATARVSVRRPTLSLTLRANASEVFVDGAVRLRLERGGEPTTGSVVVAGERHETGPDGTVVVRPRRAGTVTAVAHKEGNESVRYERPTATVEVTRRAVGLRVTLNASPALVDHPVRLTVTRRDTGEPVPATVEVGSSTHLVGKDGTTTLYGLAAGEYGVRATADPERAVRFRPASTTLTVRRERVPLSVSAAPSTLDGPGETTLTVRRGDTGARVNATVTVAGREYRTGSDGRVTVSFERWGDYEATATKRRTRAERYDAGTATVRVLEDAFRVTLVDAPSVVAPGDRANVTVRVRNVGNEAGETRVVYRLGGTVLASERVALGPGEPARVTLRALVPPTVAGTYLGTVTVADDEASGVVAVVPASGTEDATGRVGIPASSPAPAVGTASVPGPASRGRAAPAGERGAGLPPRANDPRNRCLTPQNRF